ncbi:MAG: leucine-rich repeat domain-containing protein, partial [Clostridia bacterium]|nr:leucine-rich repeat domain-containing protein [Clostridia bacterium]
TTNYTYNGDGDVSASNYDSQIVSVDINNSGKIITLKAQKVGSTTITFTAAEGTNFKAATATLTVVVEKATVTITKLAPVTKSYDGTTTAEPVKDTHYTVTSNGAIPTLKLVSAQFDLPTTQASKVTAMFEFVDTTNFKFAGYADNVEAIQVELDGQITGAQLATPTGLKWSTDDIGAATWNACPSVNGITITYKVILYKNGAAVATKETQTQGVDFAELIHTAYGEYTFNVQAISSNLDDCANSAVSAQSPALYASQITLQTGKGITAATINNAQSYVMIHGEANVEILATVASGYVFTNWSVSPAVVSLTNAAQSTISITATSAQIITITAHAIMAAPTGLVVQSHDDNISATIVNYQGNATNLVIPDTIDIDLDTNHAVTGSVYKVIAIASNAFNGNKNLQSVSIPATVITIGTYAFANCNSLTKIEILSTNVEIGDYAFGINTDDANISKQIYINDATVAKNIVKSSLYANPNLGMYDYGNLLVGANEVYIASSIVELSDFLTSSFEKIDKTTYRDVEYNVYRRRTNATATILRLREEDIDEEDITLEDFDDFI